MYSQNREEEVILNYFGDFKGAFCSIGENDGVTLSNVRQLALNGWSGVCVEPSTQAFSKLKKLYDGVKGIYTYDFAIGTHNGRMEFYESGTHLNKGDTGLLSTNNEEELKRFPGTEYTKTEVKCFRWRTALNRFRIKKFDFFSIDAEGFDMEIVEQIDFADAKLVCVEWNGVTERKAIYDAFFKDFKLIYTSPENLIYGR